MKQKFSESDFQQACEVSAAKAIHVPGSVQSFGCLVGLDPQLNAILYASENCADFIGIAGDDLCGQDVELAFGRKVMHALNNAAAMPDFTERLTRLGQFELGEGQVEIAAFGAGGIWVLQIEAVDPDEQYADNALMTFAYLVDEIGACSDEQDLFTQTADLLRHLTGYDRVRVFKFDAQFDGEIVAESRQRTIAPFAKEESFFEEFSPHDRKLMARMPLRIIGDAAQRPVSMGVADGTLAPLDISLAECRGATAAQTQHLRDLGVGATMTLSIIVNDDVWGGISFHHRRSRVPSPAQRQTLTTFMKMFATKLTALQKDSQLSLIRKINDIEDRVLADIEGDAQFEQSIARIGPFVGDILGAEGVALLIGSQTVTYGCVPDQAVLTRILSEAQSRAGTTIVVDNLAARFPELKDALNGCAGVLATAITPDRAFCIFRKAATQPEHRQRPGDGNQHLGQRGSFAPDLPEVDGCSDPWTESDVHFAQRLWVLINSADRRALMNTLNRQQTLMIDELNHRVRNILALVRSVSRQARRHYGSLESYSSSLENRIQALAAAHDIASGTPIAAVSMQQLVRIELAPYQKDGLLEMLGPVRYLRADIAPIFSLVIHELTTNAAKYGALSSEQGDVRVTIRDVENGVSIAWREAGGPEVAEPNERGFGSTLIEQAVPHEMGGTAALRFARTGVEADFFLPFEIFDLGHQPQTQEGVEDRVLIMDMPPAPFDAGGIGGYVMLLEDNYVIAKDMQDLISDFGFDEVEIAKSIDDALETIEAETPSFAILDVNLGAGQTSDLVARKLAERGVPFVFVTGYGEKAQVPDVLNHVPRLTKPVATHELQSAMMALLDQPRDHQRAMTA